VRISGSLHMTIETAVLIETLAELGRLRAAWASCNIFSTQDQAAAAIAKAGRQRFLRLKGESARRILGLYAGRINAPLLASARNCSVDDGGDATLLLHKGYELEHGSDWGETTASASHEEDVIKKLLKRCAKETSGLVHCRSQRMERGQRRNHHHGRASALPNARGGEIARARCEREWTRSQNQNSTIFMAVVNHWRTASSARSAS